MSLTRSAIAVLSLGVALSLSLLSTRALAQWMWKDESGHVVASDLPPPTGTPASRILRSPRAKSAPAVDAPAPLANEAPKGDLPKTLADRELDARQKQKDDAEAAKKADDEAARARVKQQNCNASRSNLAALQSGGRSAQVNDKGERTFITDDQRKGEINKTQGQVADFCR